MRVKEAADDLGVTVKTVWRYLNELGVRAADSDGVTDIDDDLMVRLRGLKDERRQRQVMAPRKDKGVAAKPEKPRGEVWVCPKCGKEHDIVTQGPALYWQRFGWGDPQRQLNRWVNRMGGPYCIDCEIAYREPWKMERRD